MTVPNVHLFFVSLYITFHQICYHVLHGFTTSVANLFKLINNISWYESP